MNQHFTTNAVSAKDRLGYWRDAICDVFVQLECRAPESRDFHGSLSSRSIGPLNLSTVVASAQHVLRTRRQIRKANEEEFLLSIQLEGVGAVKQDDREAPLRPGSMVLYDSTRPYELLFPGAFRQLVLQVPRRALRAIAPGAASATARAFHTDRSEVRILHAVIESLHNDVEELSPPASEEVANALTHLVAATLGIPRPSPSDTPQDLRSVHVARIRTLIARRATDPDLTPARIAAELGISVGHLHRLFEREDLSVERLVWRERLLRVAQDLADDTLADRTIESIALDCGFASAAHFCRTFRAFYETTPSEFRRALRRERPT